MMNLEDILDQLLADELRALCKRFGKKNEALTTKAHCNKFLSHRIRTMPQDVISLLDPGERFLLAEIAHTKKVPSEPSFVAKYGLPFPKKSHRWEDRKAPPTLLIGFIYKSHRHDFHVICPEVEIYRPLLPPPPESSITPLSAPPALLEGEPVRLFESEAKAFLELGRVLRLVQSGKIKVTEKTSRPTDASVRGINPVLMQPDFDLSPPKNARGYNYEDQAGAVRAHAWGVLIQQCGWAKAKKDILVLTPAGTSWVLEPSARIYKEGVETFFDDEAFDELHRVNHIRGQTGKTRRWISSPGERRDAIASAMSKMPIGEWISFDETFRFLLAEQGVIKVGGSDGLYICDAHYGHIYDEVDLSKQFTRAVLMESFATLGLVDIAYGSPHGIWPEFAESYGSESHDFLGRYDGLAAIRLTPLGAFCFGHADSYTPPTTQMEPSLRVLANHEITALTLPDPATISSLEMFAIRQSDAVWRLDQETILRTVEAGIPWATLHKMLRTSTKGDIPANIEKWFDDLEAKSRRCLLASEAVLLEWEDESDAVTLANSSGTAPLCFHAGGRRLVIPRKNLATFTREARKRGHLLPLVK
ncbi:MAG: hypothetical protein WEB60_01330 [Terrimicrobiaceae bacterium]